MTKRNEFIWNTIQVLCWFIFAGLCVQTGTLVFNYVYSLIRPVAAHNLHLGLDLSDLYEQSLTVYSMLFSLIIAISALKAVTFYQALQLFSTIKLVNPFTEQVSSVINRISYYAFSAGLLSIIAHEYAKNLSHKGFDTGMAGDYWSDRGAYMMMSAIIFVIALVFRKGIELQNENDLTV